MVAASEYNSIEEPTEGCDKKVYYNEDRLTKHVLDTDKKAIDQLETILDGVRNKLQVWKSGKYRYYIGENNKGYYIVKVIKNENPYFDLVINTVLMGNGGDYYDTLEDAEDQLRDNQPDNPEKIEDTTEPNC